MGSREDLEAIVVSDTMDEADAVPQEVSGSDTFEEVQAISAKATRIGSNEPTSPIPNRTRPFAGLIPKNQTPIPHRRTTANRVGEILQGPTSNQSSEPKEISFGAISKEQNPNRTRLERFFQLKRLALRPGATHQEIKQIFNQLEQLFFEAEI